MALLSHTDGDTARLLSLLPAVVFEARIHPNSCKFILNYINQGAATFLGVDLANFDLAAFVVEDFTRLIHPDDLDEFLARIAADGQRLRRFHWQYRVILPGVGLRWLDVQAAPEAQAEGEIVWRGIATDITSIREAEGKQRRDWECLTLASCAGDVGVWEFNFHSGAFIFNARMQEIYGLGPDMLREAATPHMFTASYDDWLTLVHREDAPRVAAEWNTALKSHSTINSVFRIRKPGGDIRHVRSWAQVICDAAGSPARGVGSTIDITEQQTLLTELSEEKEWRRVTLESIADAVISTDNEGRIIFMNAAAQAMTECSQEMALGQSLCQVVRIIDDETGEVASDPFQHNWSRIGSSHEDKRMVLLTPSGRRLDIQDSTATVRANSDEIIGKLWAFQDMTQARTLARQLERSLACDALTGLASRANFERKLREVCDEARREGREHALIFLDLDRFKIVNDSAGHPAGDAFLRAVAKLLQLNRRRHDFVARIGGDEFALLLYDCPIANAAKISRKLIDRIRAIRLPWGDKIYDIGASIGLTAITDTSPDPVELISQADVACDAAKTAGRNQVIIYSDSGGVARIRHKEILAASGIRSAIESNRLRLFAQEILALDGKGQQTRDIEILLRMEDLSGKIIGPDSFIPAAERYDLMGSLDRWVITNALIEHGAELTDATDLSISINLSANSINDPLFWPFLNDILRSSKLPPQRVHFEITETSLINNLSAARSFMSVVRASGYGLILDDFGSGLSSFNYLKQFPVDGVKIDGSFIRQLKDSPVDRAIVESINEIAHKLGARTIAEFVEDMETLEIVRAIGVDQAQGYAIGRPIPLDRMIGKERIRQLATS